MAYVTAPPSYAPPKAYQHSYGPQYGQPMEPPRPLGYGQQRGTAMMHAASMSLGQHPANIACPSCRQNIQTRIDYQHGMTCWLIFMVCLCFGLWCGCCLIPFCVDSCKDVEHSCPHCNILIGRYEPIAFGNRPVYMVHTSY